MLSLGLIGEIEQMDNERPHISRISVALYQFFVLCRDRCWCVKYGFMLTLAGTWRPRESIMVA